MEEDIDMMAEETDVVCWALDMVDVVGYTSGKVVICWIECVVKSELIVSTRVEGTNILVDFVGNSEESTVVCSVEGLWVTYILEIFIVASSVKGGVKTVVDSEDDSEEKASCCIVKEEGPTGETGESGVLWPLQAIGSWISL